LEWRNEWRRSLHKSCWFVSLCLIFATLKHTERLVSRITHYNCTLFFPHLILSVLQHTHTHTHTHTTHTHTTHTHNTHNTHTTHTTHNTHTTHTHTQHTHTHTHTHHSILEYKLVSLFVLLNCGFRQ
jgi:hypothetical protein